MERSDVYPDNILQGVLESVGRSTPLKRISGFPMGNDGQNGDFIAKVAAIVMAARDLSRLPMAKKWRQSLRDCWKGAL